ncbi:DNA-3-methyladenine glycosylase [Geovibrio ferrireducens]|uniref:DNA-3-methyladenine glycosylase n=1 Tax=Geovibrio ferrireducens TaxID=46201 RepID=UPI002245E58E|nr:DNA-3-methyladenine glycosylase [Geovibrio ferrireducens]
MKKLEESFFDRTPCEVARDLLGKVIFRLYEGIWLRAQIIETESYYLHEKGSHASLGYTEKRKALFMPAGTIYMYYARGGDSLNMSCHGEGNAVLIKSGYPYGDDAEMIRMMKKLNPFKSDGRERETGKLCSGQTLICSSLALKVPQYDAKTFDESFFMADTGYRPEKIAQAPRLGIPEGRDEHLPYRYIDVKYMNFCTKPLKNP